MLFAIAWRNIIRNWRRSLLTVMGAALGLAALLFLWGFNDGSHNRMMRNIQESIVGSIQVHKDGFFKKPRLKDYLDEPERIAKLMLENGAPNATLRLRTFALLAGDNTSQGAMLLGIDPVREGEVTVLPSKITQGRFFRPDEGFSCIIGATAAKNLEVKLGDSIVVLTQDRYDSLSADRCELVGIIESGEMGVDRGMAMVPIGPLQQMLSMQGKANEVVTLVGEDQIEDITASLKSSLGKGIEVLRWYDMYPVMKEWVRLDNAFYYIFLSIVLLIVSAGILNTVLMSMLERTHEFGVMMGLGAKRMQIASMVFIESMLLGVAGVVAGLVLGLSLVTYFGEVGIDLSAEMDTAQRFYIDPVIYAEIDLDHLLITVVAVLLSNVAAAMYPAFRASKLEPVEAIHHV